MQVIAAVRRSGVAVPPGETVKNAARIMEASGVGALAVLDGGRPMGIVTDRDLVRRVLARGLAFESRVDAVMSMPVVTIEADADIHEAFALFRTHGNRRLAVVRDGRFVAMLSVDDLLINVTADLADLIRPVTAEVIFGHHDARAPATR